MKVKRLYLQNFRSHRESDLLLDQVNFFLGHNNAGKTSLLAALEWGLTGRCFWTDRAGRGSGDLIRNGAVSATVLVDVEGAGLAVRTLNPNSLTFGGETSAIAAQAKLYAGLMTGEEDLRAALNVGAFLSMSPAGQKTYLFSVLGLRWDMDTVLEALTRWLQQEGQSGTDVQGWIKGPGSRAENGIQGSKSVLANRLRELVRPLYPPQVEAGPEVLDTIEKKLRDARRDTKRDLQRSLALQSGGGAANPAPGVTLADVLDQLAELRGRRDNILTNLASRKVERQAALASLESDLMTLRAAREALSSAGGCCPLAPDHINCTMTPPQRARLLAELAERIETKAAAVEQARLALDQTGGLSSQDRVLAADLHGSTGLETPDLSPLAKLDEQIAQSEALVDQIKAYQSALAQQEALSRECRELAASLAEYEVLVKAFGPDGIRRSALSRSLDPFTARVNENLSALTDGDYTIEFAPDLSPIVRHAGATIPARLLSTSELMRVGIAIQEAIAAHLGLRFLAIDGADLLDQDNRDRLTGFVCDRAAAGEFDQVLVFSTVGDVPPANPGLPGLKMLWVEDGTVRAI